MDNIPKIIIIEDHPIMREGLASYFLGTGRWQVLGAVSNIQDAKKLLSCTAANLILLDIQLENGWGLDIIPWLKRQTSEKSGCQHIPVMAVYSAFNDFAHVGAAISMGVQGYISKHRSESELENALLKTLEGETIIDDSVQAKINITANIFSLLTKREAEILSLVKCNISNNQIASRLGISQRTVENILSCIYDKIGIHSRLELQKL